MHWHTSHTHIHARAHTTHSLSHTLTVHKTLESQVHQTQRTLDSSSQAILRQSIARMSLNYVDRDPYPTAPLPSDESRTLAHRELERKIIIAVDGSASCEHAFDWAVANLKHPNDVLILVSIHSPLTITNARRISLKPDFTFPASQWKSDVEQSINEVKENVKFYEDKCKEKGYLYQVLLLHGNPGEALCQAVDMLKPTALVMGSRGRGAVKRTLLGSVSDYCAHNAKCPVIIVKEPSGGNEE